MNFSMPQKPKNALDLASHCLCILLSLLSTMALAPHSDLVSYAIIPSPQMRKLRSLCFPKCTSAPSTSASTNFSMQVSSWGGRDVTPQCVSGRQKLHLYFHLCRILRLSQSPPKLCTYDTLFSDYKLPQMAPLGSL